MPSFLGAKEMGIKTEWRYGTVNLSQRAETTPGVLYVNAGQALKPGVIDRRAHTAHGMCCADLVFSHRELVYNHLLSDWLRRFEEGKISLGAKWVPVLIANPDPDWDSMIATFLSMRLVERGEFPVYAEALVNYARDVFRGRCNLDVNRPESINAPHFAFLALQHLKGPDGRPTSPEARLTRGLELLDRVLSHIQMARSEAKSGPLRKSEDFLPGSPGSLAWIKDPWFADIRKLLDAEAARFQRDLTLATKLDSVLLPASEGDALLPVRAFIAPAPMESVFSKHWVKAAGYQLFSNPSGNPRLSPASDATPDPIYPRVTISVDPNFEDKCHGANLRALGHSLEQLETECRKTRNQGVDDRGGAPRYPYGYCGNNDPWNDGRDLEWTIVDAPRTGTWIPYSRIIEMTTQRRFWEIPLRHASLAMLWLDRNAKTSEESRKPLQPFPGMSGALAAYYKESADCAPSAAPGKSPQIDGITISSTNRCFPPGTCAPMTIVRVLADSRTTMESLAAARTRMIEAMGGTPPDYIFARVGFADHFAAPDRADRILRGLSDEDIGPLAAAVNSGESVFHGNRTIIFREDDLIPTLDGPDPEFESFMYLACLNESLTAFSGRTGALSFRVGQALDPVEIESLRRDFMRFRLSYFQAGAGATRRIRLICGQLATSLELAERRTIVQVHLDQMDRADGKPGEQEPAKALSSVPLLLYFVAAALVIQIALTIIQMIRR